jgi:Undecaprenyl-phosphate galactose phosphotransferase WbaP
MATKTTAALPFSATPLRSSASHSATTTLMVACDICLIVTILSLVAEIRHILTPTYVISDSLFAFFALTIMLIAAFATQGLYPGCLMHAADEIRKIFLSISTVFLIWASSAFLTKNGEAYSRSVFLFAWATLIPGIICARYLARRVASHYSWFGVPAVLLGSDRTACRVFNLLSSKRSCVRIIGLLSDDPVPDSLLKSFLGPLSLAPQLAAQGGVRYAVIAMPAERSDGGVTRQIQRFCRGFSHVVVIPDMPGLCSVGVTARELGGELGFEFPQRIFHLTNAFAKRSLDITLSFSALLLLLPVLLLIAILIRITSGGPILYRQTRYGRSETTFGAWKFRTMVKDASAVLDHHLRLHPHLRLEWQRDHKLKNDPRITVVGKWLRRFSLDELPQLWNVLTGQMSLVGPRPIVYAEISKYGATFDLYSRVRPGLTGLWQVSGRNNTTYDERVSFDEYYVHNWSIWLDIYILLCTIKVLATSEGAY